MRRWVGGLPRRARDSLRWGIADLRFLRVQQRVGDKRAEQSLRSQAELGRPLAVAGFRVVASDGTHLGWRDHVRDECHADHPDEIVVRRRGSLRRTPCFHFGAVETVRPSADRRGANRGWHSSAHHRADALIASRRPGSAAFDRGKDELRSAAPSFCALEPASGRVQAGPAARTPTASLGYFDRNQPGRR